LDDITYASKFLIILLNKCLKIVGLANSDEWEGAMDASLWSRKLFPLFVHKIYDVRLEAFCILRTILSGTRQNGDQQTF